MSSGVFRVLAVCTGNLCRSPMLERVLASRFAAAGAGWYDVSSAGTLAIDGEPMQPHTERVLTDAGYDTTGFAARRLDVDLLGDLDLIVTATFAHRGAVVTLWPESLRSTFQVSELVALAGLAPRPRPAPSLVGGARAAVGSVSRRRGRAPTAELRDLEDPMGGRLSAYRACLAQVERDADAIARVLLP